MLADLHCDTFYKCFAEKTDFTDKKLHINLKKGLKMLPYIQTFAHYIPEDVPDKFEFFCRMLQNSLSVIEDNEGLLLYSQKSDMERAEREGRILAVLSVEGGNFFDGDRSQNLRKITFLEQNRIRFLSLCYNSGSALCGGAKSERDGGVTRLGMEVCSSLAEHGIALDVSHLGQKSAMDILNSDLPALATHSDCFAICDSPRNLGDEGIERLIDKGGLMGINMYSPFLKHGGDAKISDVYLHINHIKSLGGEHILAFGADFDGCDSLPAGIHGVTDIKKLDIPHELFYNNVKRFLNSL